MKPHEAAALAAVADAYGEPVAYSGGAFAETISAIRSDVSAEAFQGAGSTLREVSYEIRFAALPIGFRPRKGHRIGDATGDWQVLEPRRREDIAAWILIVEESEPSP